jgi:hypothetical protein
MQNKFETARDISEYLLDRTGRAMMVGHFDNFKPHFALPHHICTYTGQLFLKTEDDLQRTFNAMLAYLRKYNVSDMVRHCVEAEFQDPDTVAATHETRLVSGNIITQSPYAVFSILKFNGTDWQISSSSYAIADREEHNAALMCAGRTAP